MTIRVSIEKGFQKGLKSLPPSRMKAAKNALLKFIENPGNNSLDFRSFKGLKEHYLIDSSPGDRIILRKTEIDLYAVLDVGPHDNILRRWNR